MYTVRCFFNTGFNAINVPDSPALLASFTYRDFPSIDLLQARELSEITIRAAYADIKDADYCYIQNTSDTSDFVFYSVDNVVMTSQDVCTLTLTIDYLNTAGGIAQLEILDGITDRHHVAKTDDLFGAYTEDDPLMIPSKPLKLVSGSKYPARTYSGNDYVIAESTSSLTQMGETKSEPAAKKAIYYESGTEESSVTIPDTAPIKPTEVSTYAMIIDGVAKEVPSAGSALYVIKGHQNSGNQGIVSSDGIAALRALGAENAVLNAYVIPRDFLSTGDPTFVSDSTTKADGTAGPTVTNEHIGKITGIGLRQSLISGELPYVYDPNVKNVRCLYGNLNKYGICAIATGNTAEFNPEEIYHAGDVQPTLEIFADPRPTGNPFFRFSYLHGNDQNVFLNSIAGAKWQNAPLVYSDRSGSTLDTIKLQSQQAISRDQFQVSGGTFVRELEGQGASIAMGRPTGGTIAASIVGQGVADYLGATRGMSAGEQAFTSAVLNPLAARKRAFQQELAMQDIDLGLRNVVAPVVSFPRTDGIRDYVGNTCMVYRYRPDATDLAKIDKILTMYGYKDTVPFTADMLSNRSKFNYVKASGVSVKIANKPKWIRDGVASMFNVGLRIWHVAPDSTIYTNGTNV